MEQALLLNETIAGTEERYFVNEQSLWQFRALMRVRRKNHWVIPAFPLPQGPGRPFSKDGLTLGEAYQFSLLLLVEFEAILLANILNNDSRYDPLFLKEFDEKPYRYVGPIWENTPLGYTNLQGVAKAWKMITLSMITADESWKKTPPNSFAPLQLPVVPKTTTGMVTGGKLAQLMVDQPQAMMVQTITRTTQTSTSRAPQGDTSTTSHLPACAPFIGRITPAAPPPQP